MQINRKNYEAYILDYWEGNLDQNGIDDLALFFRQNPELKKHFVNFREFHLQPDESIVFDRKDDLKKIEVQQVGEINQENYEEWIIASQEGDLSTQEQKQFEEFIDRNPAVQKEVSLFLVSVLKPDESVVYHSRETLKKNIPFYYQKALLWPVSIAAMLVIIFGVFSILKNETQTITNQPGFLTEEIKPLDNKSAEKVDEISGLPRKDLVVEAEIPTIDPLPIDTENTLLADTEQAEVLYNSPLNIEITNKQVLAEQVDLTSMERITFSEQIAGYQDLTSRISDRSEMSSAFEYMIVRDALNEELAVVQNEKSTVGKIFANLGNKIFGSSSNESNSIFQEFSETQKQSFNQIAEGMPVYRESDEAGRTSTYLALSENLKLRISKNKNKEKVENPKGVE